MDASLDLEKSRPASRGDFKFEGVCSSLYISCLWDLYLMML